MDNNYILSFMGLAPMSNPEVGVYLAIDNPKDTIQYGGVVAAPLVGEILAEILPLLGVKPDYENQIDKELRWYIDPIYHKVPNFIGMSKKDLPTKWNGEYKYLFLGEGNTIIEQSPSAGEKIKDGGTIIVYLG